MEVFKMNTALPGSPDFKASKHCSIRPLASLILMVLMSGNALAQDDTSATVASATPPQESDAPVGILPVPDYSGDFSTRAFLTGDWGGGRATLADKGIQANAEYYQYYQAITSGGVDDADDDYWGGKANYRLNIDLQKMGLMPGGLIYARFDARWGESANGHTGQLLPSNEAFLVPVYYDNLERETAGRLTALTYTQFLSPKFAIYGGKIDMMDGDPNEFAGGRGDTQFLNYNMMFAAPTAIVPASTLGAGFMYMPNKHVTFVSELVSATDSTFVSVNDAVDDWSDGQIWANVLMTQYRVSDLPGGFNLEALNWFNADFQNIGSQIGDLTSEEDTSWLVGLSAWQYLYTEEASEGPLDATNKIPDLQGWGLFARLGFADKKTNPFKTTASIGVGGRGIFPGRDHDLFGLGYFYTETDPDNILTVLGSQDSVQGVEVFYNLFLTPAAKLSFDVQWLEASVPTFDNAVVIGTVDDAVVVGARLQLIF
jgi:porin